MSVTSGSAARAIELQDSSAYWYREARIAHRKAEGCHWSEALTLERKAAGLQRFAAYLASQALAILTDEPVQKATPQPNSARGRYFLQLAGKLPAGLVATADDCEYLDGQAGVYRDLDGRILHRQLIERAVIRQACTDLLAAGFELRVHDGEEWASERTGCVPNGLAEVMRNIQACDEETIAVYRTDKEGRVSRCGVLCLVYGNDGHDVIADNSTSVEPHLAGATALADRIAEEV